MKRLKLARSFSFVSLVIAVVLENDKFMVRGCHKIKKNQLEWPYSLSRGPVCFACDGENCGELKLRTRDDNVQCDIDDTCMTVKTTKMNPTSRATYFRGCGKSKAGHCVGNRGDRPPLRSTAGQFFKKEEFCKCGLRVCQCMTCCVTDFCNGGQILTSSEHKQALGMANEVSQPLTWISIYKYNKPSNRPVFGPFCLTAFVVLITLTVAFPP